MGRMTKILDTKGADLPWLWSFNDDYIRLIAVGLICLTIVAVFCGRHWLTVWRLDRDSRRKYELQNSRLQAKIAARKGVEE
jgi:hypothetical protein